jgi:hypothetical protein
MVHEFWRTCYGLIRRIGIEHRVILIDCGVTHELAIFFGCLGRRRKRGDRGTPLGARVPSIINDHHRCLFLQGRIRDRRRWGRRALRFAGRALRLSCVELNFWLLFSCLTVPVYNFLDLFRHDFFDRHLLCDHFLYNNFNWDLLSEQCKQS